MANRKKPNKVDKFLRMATGLQIGWKDPEPTHPTNELLYDKYCNHSELIKSRFVEGFYTHNRRVLYDLIRLNWVLDVTAVFVYPNGLHQYEGSRTTAFGAINEFNRILGEIAVNLLRYGNVDHFKYLDIKLLCLGVDREYKWPDDYEVDQVLTEKLLLVSLQEAFNDLSEDTVPE